MVASERDELRGELPAGAVAVVDGLYEPAMLLWLDGTIAHANAAAMDRFGAAPGLTCRDVVHRRADECGPCALVEAREQRRARGCEFARDGFRLALRVNPIGENLLLASLATASAVASLEGGNDLLQAILDSTSDVVIAVDRAHRVEFVNRAFVQRTGVPAASVVGKDFRAIWPAPPGITWKETNERVLQGGEAIRLPDVKYDSPVSGGTVWADILFSPRRDPEGRIVGTVTTVRYLTAERRLELQLRESERRHQELFEQAPVGLLIVGRDRRIVLVNPTLARLSGIDDLVGQPFDELLPADERQRLVSVFERVVGGGGWPAEGIEFGLMRSDGKRLSMHARGGLVDFRGEHCVQAVLVDLTETRRLQAQLAQAEKLSGLGTLAAGVAHEFNNLLAAIQGRAELIVESAAAGTRAHAGARAIVRHCRRGVELIDEIAEFSSPRPPRCKVVRWSEVVEEALACCATWLEHENVRVERALEARRAVFADPGQLQQVVLNLLQNARDAVRPMGGGAVRIATFDDDAEVVLQVSDSGVGMDDSVRQRIFEPFFTTKVGTERTGGLATGLGLAICYGIVRAHGGRIEVASRPRKGSTFTVRLAARETDRTRRRLAVARPLPRPLAVLLVDDEEEAGALAAQRLTALGCSVQVESDPVAVLEGAAGLGADLLVVDLVMPRMDGIELLRGLRARGVTTPALLLSGRRRSLDPGDLERLGVRGRLRKPVDAPELCAAIEAATGVRPWRRAPGKDGRAS